MDELTVTNRPAIPDFEVNELPASGGVNREVWKINATIQQLSYLSHNIFRYYGKFPSVLARKLIERYSVAGDTVLDNMTGCGTTQVEATLLGRNAVGLDVNPLAVMAARVKTNTSRIEDYAERWSALSTHMQGLLVAPNLFSNGALKYKHHVVEHSDIGKWFPKDTIEQLAKLRAVILGELDVDFREFLHLALAAIVRRVSMAYDGEVRPHFNPNKRPRSVYDAFSGKVSDMIERLRTQRDLLPNRDVTSDAFVHDARLPLHEFVTQQPTLIISHPPYLNCFNYVPIYRWEMLWLGLPYHDFVPRELLSWPAKDRLVKEYYAGHKQIVSSGLSVLSQGGYYCIVIGDCTIQGRVERTHTRFIEFCQELGLRLDTVIYRDTHYGIGRYAYSHRAEYNHDAGEDYKRDAILVFQKP